MKAEKKPKEKREKQPKPPREGHGRGAAIVALLLSLASLGIALFLIFSGQRAARLADRIAKDNETINQKVAALEEAAAAEKNRESAVIQMEPHGLAVYMGDSAALYKTKFSSIRYEGAEAVKLRAPVTVTIYNTSEQTITVKSAVMYPWETIFEETARQETLAAQQEKGFYGELTQGKRADFSIAPGESAAMEVDARLRGVYGHPALETETHQFFMDYFSDPEHAVPNIEDDIAIKGKGQMNGQVNYLFHQALAYYCAQRRTQFTLNYVIKTERGNTFMESCTMPF